MPHTHLEQYCILHGLLVKVELGTFSLNCETMEGGIGGLGRTDPNPGSSGPTRDDELNDENIDAS